LHQKNRIPRKSWYPILSLLFFIMLYTHLSYINHLRGNTNLRIDKVFLQYLTFRSIFNPINNFGNFEDEEVVESAILFLYLVGVISHQELLFEYGIDQTSFQYPHGLIDR
jgi:hypothetical protein